MIQALRRIGLGRRYLAFALGVVVFTVAMGVAERAGWSRLWLGSSFLFATVAVYAAIGLMSRTAQEDEYYVAGRRVPAVYNGMATAADWMSIASFVGTAGVLYLNGYAGLAYVLGWTGGYCLVALLLAPYLRRFGQFTVPDYLGARYGGVAVRLAAVVGVLLVSMLYLIVQLYGVGLIGSHLTGLSFELGIFVGLGGVLVCSFLGGMRAVTWTQVAQYIILIMAFLVPVVWLCIKQLGHPVPMLGMVQQLGVVQQAEQRLLNDPDEREVQAIYRARADASMAKLADVPTAMAVDAAEARARLDGLRSAQAPLAAIQRAERELMRMPRSEDDARRHYEDEVQRASRQALPLSGMPEHSQPFSAGGEAAPVKGESARADEATRRLNFVALVFCLMLGTAGMPHVLTRYYTTPSVSQARHSVVWSLLFIALLYMAAPTLAAFVKVEVFNHLVGSSYVDLPAWIGRWTRVDPGLVSVEDVNGDGILQLGELVLGADLIVLAAPEIGGLPYVVTCLVAAGGLAAALSTADGLLLTLASSLSNDVYYRILDPRAGAVRRVMLSKVLVLVIALLAAYIASLHLANVLRLVSLAFSLAAAIFVPALVLGIFWRRANRWGALAGMHVGLLTCLTYLAINSAPSRAWLGLAPSLAGERWFGIDPVAAGVFGVPAGLAATVLVSLLTPPPQPREAAWVDTLRYPTDSEAPRV